jgi:autotransporter-associated beta strand protein
MINGTVLHIDGRPVTGTVVQGVAVGTAGMGVVLDGTAIGNIVSGNIMDAADYDNSSNANALPLNLTKTGTGTWTLSGTNSYAGGTTITTGKLQFNGANALPTTGTVAVGAAGHLSLADNTARNQTVSALTLTSLASLSFDWTGSTGDQLTSTAAITPTAGSGFYVNLNLSGTPSGSVTLLTGGAGSTLSSSTFYLANATNYTATLATPAVNTLVLNGYTSQTPANTLYWVGDKLSTTIAGVRNAWALSDGTKGNWSSSTTAYTATPLTPGATTDAVFANGQAGKTQQSTVLGSDVTVKSVTIDDSVAVTIAGANGAVLTLMGTSGTAGTVASPGSAISVTANANATSTISSSVNLGANQTWHVASGKTLTVSGIVGGGFGLTKASPGTLTLSALPEYTGATTISAGTLILGSSVANGSSVLASSGITLSQGATLLFSTGASGAQLVAAPITLSGGAGTASIKIGLNDKAAILSGGVTGQAAVIQTLAITTGAVATGSGDRDTFYFTGAIANGGSGGTLGVSVDFAGSSGAAQNAFVNLQGLNTFTGDLSITNSRGINGGTAYPGAWVTIGGERHGVTSSGTANSIGQSIGNGYLGGGNYAGNISISAGTGLTTLSYFSTANQTLSGIISGTGALQMDGTGTLTLSGNNTYTGTTTVSGGRLVLSGEKSIADTGTLNIAGGKVEVATKEKVTVLQYSGTTQPVGTYGSTSSTANNKNNTYFSGTGVLYVGVEFPPAGTLILFM